MKSFEQELKEAQAEITVLRKKLKRVKRETWNAAWEAVSTYAGDQGPRDPLVDPEMARDAAYRAYTEREKE